jgi:hypothetical protein
MAYPEVVTKKRFNKEEKAIISRCGTFLVLLLIAYGLIGGMPSTFGELLNLVGPVFMMVFLMFIGNYMSLEKSYKKHKDLLDDA